MKHFLAIITITFLISSCTKPLDYKYQDKKQINVCKGLDAKLASEAYYSFREDLAEYTKKTNVSVDYLDYQYSLALYIYNGTEGLANYKSIASSHSLEIFKKLQNEEQLWVNPATGKINYNSEFIDCLLKNIQNNEVRLPLISLRDTGSINKLSLAELFRTTIKDAETDPAYAMFIAFETYYKFFPKIKK